jgi:hypothetical protein
MFLISDILVWIWIRGSVPLTDPEQDPAPDPAFFVSELQDNKNLRTLRIQNTALIAYKRIPYSQILYSITARIYIKAHLLCTV